jgi:hypothetical protein
VGIWDGKYLWPCYDRATRLLALPWGCHTADLGTAKVKVMVCEHSSELVSTLASCGRWVACAGGVLPVTVGIGGGKEEGW